MLTVANVKNHSYNHKQISTGVIIEQRKEQNKKRVLTGEKLAEICGRSEHSSEKLLYR
jgi:hypothetical protein